jgi:hypothetical protein
VIPFTNGAYSQMDREYVDNTFSKYTWVKGVMHLAPNWQITHKCPIWRKTKEKKWGFKLPKDAEVWSRPEKYEEIYMSTVEPEGKYEFPEHIKKIMLELAS